MNCYINDSGLHQEKYHHQNRLTVEVVPLAAEKLANAVVALDNHRRRPSQNHHHAHLTFTCRWRQSRCCTYPDHFDLAICVFAICPRYRPVNLVSKTHRRSHQDD
ncbi:MAG: hypothetical protein ACI8PV_001377 [Dinoroseobacter sp.]